MAINSLTFKLLTLNVFDKMLQVKSLYLSSLLLFLDVDECTDDLLNPCDQVCVNSIGSYMCECNIGYYLTNNNKCLGNTNIF